MASRILAWFGGVVVVVVLASCPVFAATDVPGTTVPQAVTALSSVSEAYFFGPDAIALTETEMEMITGEVNWDKVVAGAAMVWGAVVSSIDASIDYARSRDVTKWYVRQAASLGGAIAGGYLIGKGLAEW